MDVGAQFGRSCWGGGAGYVHTGISGDISSSTFRWSRVSRQWWAAEEAALGCWTREVIVGDPVCHAHLHHGRAKGVV
jgi:hypothetical protein